MQVVLTFHIILTSFFVEITISTLIKIIKWWNIHISLGFTAEYCTVYTHFGKWIKNIGRMGFIYL